MSREAKWMIGCVVACLVLVSAASAEGPGGYGNSPYAWIHAGGYETEDPVLFDEAAYEWQWGAPPIVGSAYALGDIRSPESGTAKARSSIFYHDPFGSDWLSIGADVETWKPFLVESGTLPGGTTIDVTLSIHYAGTLQALESTPDKYSYAHANGAVTLYNDLGGVLGQRSGEAEVECELIDEEREYSVEAEGDWTGRLSGGVDGNGDPIYSLLYEDTIDFSAKVGERYWLYFDLATSVKSSTGSALGWEGSATFAEADFSNTGSYLLSSGSDVQFVTVPEPSMPCLLIAMGVLSLVVTLKRGR